MYTDPIIPLFVSSIFIILLLGFLMEKLRQPHVIVYILAGVVLGPSMLGMVQDQLVLSRIGNFGVILLMFFIGMEVSPKRLAENWLVSIIGTILQIFTSVFLVYLLGIYFHWSLNRCVLLGFVISISSTSVVLYLLNDWRELNTRVGQDVLGILLVQDILIVPMLIGLNVLGGNTPTLQTLLLQSTGGICLLALTIWLVIKENIRLPWLIAYTTNNELRVFLSLGICFGMAMITSFFQLSAALGAFTAGMLVSSTHETLWVHQSLTPIRTIFMAIFFVSVGMMIDLDFIKDKIVQISLLVLAAYLTNTIINAFILKSLGETWEESWYGGSLLSQIGEFSFIIASLGYQVQLIEIVSYKMTVAVISICLLLSPPWIIFIKHITKIKSYA